MHPPPTMGSKMGQKITKNQIRHFERNFQKMRVFHFSTRVFHRLWGGVRLSDNRFSQLYKNCQKAEKTANFVEKYVDIVENW